MLLFNFILVMYILFFYYKYKRKAIFVERHKLVYTAGLVALLLEFFTLTIYGFTPLQYLYLAVYVSLYIGGGYFLYRYYSKGYLNVLTNNREMVFNELKTVLDDQNIEYTTLDKNTLRIEDKDYRRTVSVKPNFVNGLQCVAMAEISDMTIYPKVHESLTTALSKKVSTQFDRREKLITTAIIICGFILLSLHIFWRLQIWGQYMQH